MDSARIQQFCEKHVNLGCFDGKKINAQKMTRKNLSFFIKNIHICSIRKPNNTSFNQAIEEVNLNFKLVDDVISGKNDKGFLKYEYDPKTSFSINILHICV